MRKFLLGGMTVASLALFGFLAVNWVSAWAEEKEAKADHKCPISGKESKDEFSLNVNGKKVTFCCDNCPKAYAKKINLKDDGPKDCPVSGKPAKAEEKLIHQESKWVAFCCENCPKGFAKKNGYEITDKGAKKCAACEKEAKADFKVVANGNTKYFCCDSCKKGFIKELGVGDKHPTECAVSGKPVKEGTEMIFTTSKAVYFCCGNCPAAYVKKNIKKE